MGVIVEGASDQHVEAGVAGFAGGGDQIGAGDGTELRANEDGGALLGAGVFVALDVPACSADQRARPWRD